jgi:hypothetical protein
VSVYTNHARLCCRCGSVIRVGDMVRVTVGGLECASCASRPGYVPGPTEYKRALLNPIPAIRDQEVRERIEEMDGGRG